MGASPVVRERKKSTGRIVSDQSRKTSVAIYVECHNKVEEELKLIVQN